MLSASYQGALPGIDLALLLDSAAYHMTADTPDRIRPGTLQAGPAACCAMGVMSGCFCAKRHSCLYYLSQMTCLRAPLVRHCEGHVLQAMGENVLGLVLEYGRVLRNGTDAAPATGKLIFFDVLGLFMVRHASPAGLGKEAPVSVTVRGDPVS